MKSLGIRRGERDTYLLPSSPSAKSDMERANEIVQPKLSLSKSQIEALGIGDWDVGDKGKAEIQFEVVGVEKGDTSTYGYSIPAKNKKLSMTIALVGADTAETTSDDVEEPAEIELPKKSGRAKPSRVSASDTDLDD